MGLKEWFIQRAVKKQVEKLKKENPKMFNFLKGKRTYLVAIVTALVAGAQALGYNIPNEIYAVLGALGLGTLRAGIVGK